MKRSIRQLQDPLHLLEIQNFVFNVQRRNMNLNLELAKIQLERELDQMQKEEEFYFSHGCTKSNTDTFLCPPNTPRFVYEPEPKV
jgi:uncharacterized protein YggL (DUF469 family)